MRTWILGLLLFTAASLAGDVSVERDVRLFGRDIVFTPRSFPDFESQQFNRNKPSQCCKVCTKGKPCGDTCIDKDDTCHVGPGCAC
jgi:hypothetical protein